MDKWRNIIRVLIVLIGIIVLSFDALLYYSFERQKAQIDAISTQQQTDAQVNSNKFKYQQDQIEHMSKDLEDALQQVKGQNDALVEQKEAVAEQKEALAAQKDALLQEVEKRQQIANESKGIQTSLVDIKAEADAIKQDMKGWQKDYVTILAQLEKKMDSSQDEIKSLEDNLTALNIPELKKNIDSLKADLEKNTQPVDNSADITPLPAPDKKIERTDISSQ